MDSTIAKKIYSRVNIFNVASTIVETPCDPSKFKKIHFACGNEIISDWLNVDLRPTYRFSKADRQRYMRLNLCGKYPFKDGHFQFGYSQDFLEHLSQADSIIYLSEAFRILAPGGVLRISSPGLKNVLAKHYRKTDFEGSRQGKLEAYTMWGHHHFYSEETIALVAKHLGFRKVEVRPANESVYPELRGLDTRLDQADLNLIVELTK